MIRLFRSLNLKTDVKFVSTAMHGVGHRFASKAFEMFSLKPFFPVESQKDPDPEFPTVAFPNPEEKGALVSLALLVFSLNGGSDLWSLPCHQDLAVAEAVKQEALYVLAQDPDADRFAAAEMQ